MSVSFSSTPLTVLLVSCVFKSFSALVTVFGGSPWNSTIFLRGGRYNVSRGVQWEEGAWIAVEGRWKECG